MVVLRKVFVNVFLLISITIYATDTYVVSSGVKESTYNNFSADILTQAYNNAGFDVSFHYTSLERSLLIANSGEVDGDIFRSDIVESLYPNLLRVNEPLFYVDWVGFSTNKYIVVNKWSDLKGYKVAVVRGIKRSIANTESMDRVVADTIDKAFLLLKKNRVDIVIDSYYRGKLSALRVGITDPVYTTIPLASTPMYHYLNSSNRDIVPDLEVELKKLAPSLIIEEVLKSKIREAGGLP